MLTLEVQDFSLQHTLESGQVYRWFRLGEWYWGIVGDRILRVHQEGNRIQVASNRTDNLDILVKEYFQLEQDYQQITDRILVDKYIQEAVDRLWGLRITRQQPLECLITFMLTSNNSIPMTRYLVENLARAYGTRASFEGYNLHLFPTLDQLTHVTEKEFRALRIGFRSSYLIEMLTSIRNGVLPITSFHNMTYEEGMALLQKVRGIGQQIADCFLLFAGGKYEAAAIDVWLHRMYEEYYFGGKKTALKEVLEFSRQHFGGYPGAANQFLYHHYRLQKIGGQSLPNLSQAGYEQLSFEWEMQ